MFTKYHLLCLNWLLKQIVFIDFALSTRLFYYVLILIFTGQLRLLLLLRLLFVSAPLPTNAPINETKWSTLLSIPFFPQHMKDTILDRGGIYNLVLVL